MRPSRSRPPASQLHNQHHITSPNANTVTLSHSLFHISLRSADSTYRCSFPQSQSWVCGIPIQRPCTIFDLPFRRRWTSTWTWSSRRYGVASDKRARSGRSIRWPYLRWLSSRKVELLGSSFVKSRKEGCDFPGFSANRFVGHVTWEARSVNVVALRLAVGCIAASLSAWLDALPGFVCFVYVTERSPATGSRFSISLDALARPPPHHMIN